MVTIHSVLATMRGQFRAAGLDTPELDARLLAQAALGMTQEDIAIKNNELINETQLKTLTEMTQRRLQREPVSRILGKRAFWKSEFKVSRETLDPRADSETIIEKAVACLDRETAATILDLGTGTGCLLLSLLQELPKATGLGIDISEDAVQTARQNAESLGLSGRSNFMSINWKDFKPEKHFDILISNPPYISTREIENLAPEVNKYDPLRALAGGEDGLDCYREIAALLPRFLAPAGRAFLEIGATQAEDVKGILAACGYHVLEVVPDLSGHNRCVIARQIS